MITDKELHELVEKKYPYATIKELDEALLPFANSIVDIRRQTFIAGYKEALTKEEAVRELLLWLRKNHYLPQTLNTIENITEEFLKQK